MTTEEKELLLKDLCARLPYGVKVQITSDGGMMEASYDMTLDCELLNDLIENDDDFKPYLRPMSSMTKEKRKEIENIFLQDTQEIFKDPMEIRASSFYDTPALDWFLKKQFDYRKLIEKGLALEAPEDMYKTK